jgi:hypothetical protein
MAQQRLLLTPAQRALRARLAANARWARADPIEGTQAARDAFLTRFGAEVDPAGTVPQAERTRRAVGARRSYMPSLALRSSRARQQRSPSESRL